MSKLICITGLDGVGKSTLIESLLTSLNSAHHCSIWDLMFDDKTQFAVPFKEKKDLYEYQKILTPNSRLLFYAHCLYASLELAISSKKEFIILDGYFYKYCCTEFAYGADYNLVKSVSDCFPKPELVFKIELQTEIAAMRKKTFSPYECMMQESNAQSFISAQNKFNAAWIALDYNKNSILLNSENTVDSLVFKIKEYLK